MSQFFSLCTELTVRQNLELHARLFHVPAAAIPGRVDEMVERFDLAAVIDSLPDRLPLGIRQRLPPAVAMLHKPEWLSLAAPTSGVAPVARDRQPVREQNGCEDSVDGVGLGTSKKKITE